MHEGDYNLPMVRENFISRNIKKLFQGFLYIKKKRKSQRRNQKRNNIMSKKNKQNRNIQTVAITETHQRVDIYEFQAMYRRGEISIENMNEDQKYALVKLFGLQNEKLRESIKEHKRNTEAYNCEVERLKKELQIIG